MKSSFYYNDLTWKPQIRKEERPVYKAIVSALETDIKNGVLKPGDRLPPQRELAYYLGINLSTVTRAFKICEQKGIIFAAIGRGTFISVDAVISSTTEEHVPSIIDLGRIHSLYNDNRYLTEAITKISQKLSVEDYFGYDEPKHQITHQQIGVKWLKKVNFDTCSENICVASGSQNALAITLLSLFQPGDKIGTSSLTYTGFKSLANMIGIKLVPIDMDNHGIKPESLVKVCKNEGIKGLYIMPECQNPTTYSLPLEKRKEIANIVERNNLILIEDDTFSFLGNTGISPVSSFVPEHSIYISSISKAISIGLRVSFLHVPVNFQQQIRHGIYNINMTTSHFNVEIVANLIETGAADRIIEQKQLEAEERNHIVDDILSGFTVYGNKRDYFRWLVLPEQWTGKDFEFCARSTGVQVFSAERFIVGANEAPAAVRISTSAVKGVEELRKGLIVIKELLNSNPNPSLFFI